MRFNFIDVAKATCIFLMVVGHWTTNYTASAYIYAFHMQALFVISGFLYKPRNGLKTIVSMAVPVVVFSLIYLLYLLYVEHLDLQSSEIILGFTQHRYGLKYEFFRGIWFIWALLGLRLLFGDIKFLSPLRNYALPLAVFCTAYMTYEKQLVLIADIFHGYYLSKVIPTLPFFCFGMYLRQRGWQPTDVPARWLPLLLAIFLLLPPLNGETGIYGNMFGHGGYTAYALIAMAITVLLFYASSKIPPSRFVREISKGTLLILGLHIPLLRLLHGWLPAWLDVLSPVFVLLICYYPIVWCDKYCPLLLGKWPK